MLECLSVSHRHGGHAVLDAVSLAIAPGEIHQISGPSGGGKTTLLRILCLFDLPTAGVVRLDGRVFAHRDIFKPRAWLENEPFRRDVTLVSQQIFLWPHLTCRENIELVAHGSSSYLAMAERFNVASCLDRHPNQVSVGQRQRIALIRAVASRPRYLLLDEVTSALDQAMSEVAADFIVELTQSGIGTLMVTHRQHGWRGIVPKSWWIEHGRLSWIR